MNERLDDSVRCFLIRIEVWQIGDSKPAPRFEIISVKNDWAATLQKSTTTAGLSSVRLSQLEFWQNLHAYIRAKDPSIRLHTPRAQGWLNFGIGSRLAHISLVINTQKNRFSSELYITDNKDLFAFLKSSGEEIQSKLGAKVDWFEANIASGLKVYNQVEDVFDESRQVEYFEWLYLQVLKFKEVLNPYLKDFLTEISD